jgi:hypothetical protein
MVNGRIHAVAESEHPCMGQAETRECNIPDMPCNIRYSLIPTLPSSKETACGKEANGKRGG